LHFAVSSKPHSQWAIQRLRETFAFDETTKYVLRDNDKIFSEDFKINIKRFGLEHFNFLCSDLGHREDKLGKEDCAAILKYREQI